MSTSEKFCVLASQALFVDKTPRISTPKITSVLRLFRVQDARAALPQNCSPAKLNATPNFANGTSVPALTPKVPNGYPSERPVFVESRAGNRQVGQGQVLANIADEKAGESTTATGHVCNPGPEIYRIVLESMRIGVCAVDLENKIMFWNDVAERITGYLRHEVMGRSCADNIQLHCNHAKCELCPQRCPLATAVHSARPVEANGFFHHKAGHRTPVHIWAVPIRNQHGPIIGAAQSFDRQRTAPGAGGGLRAGNHTWLDEMTGVANHAMMQSHLREALSTFAELQVPFGVLGVRLDDLERLRANYGQEAAHSMLRVIAQTLEQTLRPTDYVGRWNEDQFLTVLTGCSESGLPAVCDRIEKMIASGSIEWWGGELFAGAVSLGKAFPESGDTAETLMERLQHLLAKAGNSQRADSAAAGSGGEGPKS